jgi:predicted RecB family nuclease
VALTDLPMIKQGRAEKLAKAGIDTVEKLWKADLDKLAASGQFDSDVGFLRTQIPLLQGFAEAHATGKAVVYAADERLWSLDEPIIHMDLEFDGPAREIFLYGMLDHHSGEVTTWFDHTRSGQEKLLKDFIAICKDQRPTMVTWGGATSDTVQLRRASEKYGINPKWVNEVSWFDLQTEVVYTGNPETQRIYLPVTKFKSERVAQFFGYQKPRLNVKDGYHALRLYRTYMRRQDAKIKKDLCDYNAEDIRHTRLVLDGLRELMAPLR